jgi:hypothetical protein
MVLRLDMVLKVFVPHTAVPFVDPSIVIHDGVTDKS